MTTLKIEFKQIESDLYNIETFINAGMHFNKYLQN